MEHNVHVFPPFVLMGHLLQYFFDQRQCFAFTDIVPRFQQHRLYWWALFQAMAVDSFLLGRKGIRQYCFSLSARISLLQSWTKVLWTVLQYSYYSVISRFPLKTVQRLPNFLAVLLPPPYTKLDTRVQHCLWVEGRGWIYVQDWKTPQKCKSVPRLLSTIV